MNLSEAFQIVLDLARENIIDDPELNEERLRQERAIHLVSCFAEEKFDGKNDED